jgi:hypothetical protein
MFSSTVLDVAVGVIFTFLTVSLICGLLTEVWATVASWRANTLLAGVQSLVNDPDFTGLAQTLYQHALVNPRGDGSATTPDGLVNKPAYIDPLHFAGAMLDSVNIVAGTADQMKSAIAGSPLLAENPQMKTMLTGMADRAQGNVDAMRTAIGVWFDAGMDRVSGNYKRWTQVYCFGFGLLMAMALNIDTLEIARTLWQQPQITHAITTTMSPTDAFGQMQTLNLPIGWDAGGLQCPKTFTGWLAKILGFAITALSTLFGATFWFDALSGVLKMRGNGPAPDRTTS